MVLPVLCWALTIQDDSAGPSPWMRKDSWRKQRRVGQQQRVERRGVPGLLDGEPALGLLAHPQFVQLGGYVLFKIALGSRVVLLVLPALRDLFPGPRQLTRRVLVQPLRQVAPPAQDPLTLCAVELGVSAGAQDVVGVYRAVSYPAEPYRPGLHRLEHLRVPGQVDRLTLVVVSWLLAVCGRLGAPGLRVVQIHTQRLCQLSRVCPLHGWTTHRTGTGSPPSRVGLKLYVHGGRSTSFPAFLLSAPSKSTSAFCSA